jgi:hypothetical protein
MGGVEQRFQLAHEETHRLALQRRTEPGLELENRSRAGAERTVVEKDHAVFPAATVTTAASAATPRPRRSDP